MLSKRISDRHWWLVILSGWLVLLGLPNIYKGLGSIVPGSFWIDVQRIEVTDQLLEDGRRVIIYERDLKRNFTGDWVTTEDYLDPSTGGFVSVRTCKGSTEYDITKTPPNPPTLRWLTGRITDEERARGVFDNCKWEYPYNYTQTLPEGQYRVCVTVYVETVWGRKKEYACSNTYRDPLPEASKVLVR